MDIPLDHDQQEEVANLLDAIALGHTEPTSDETTKTLEPSATADDNVAAMVARFLAFARKMFAAAREMKPKASGIEQDEDEWRFGHYMFSDTEKDFYQSYRDLNQALKPTGLKKDEFSRLLRKSFIASQAAKLPETDEEQQRKQVLRAESQKPPLQMDIADLELFLRSDVPCECCEHSKIDM